MPLTPDVLGTMGVAFAGLRFASWAEALFALGALIPLAFFAACALYLWRLLLSALPARNRGSGIGVRASADVSALSIPEPWTARPFFVLLIPAHDEELVLGKALDSLAVLDYPRRASRIVVIADNCSDR